jgi:MFS family permease
MPSKETQRNTPAQVLFASLIGTTVEFFDFYIYATAAVLVFPKLFFPAGNAAAATLASLATFGIAFFARPIGSALFGHFGDRVGRKTTLVLALSTMGLSTFAIGVLPTYKVAGILSSLLLALCRFGQGIGLGGEWGGAVLLATENAPPGKRAWYGMFPQLGAPVGFFLSSSIFLVLSKWLSPAQFLAFGWRLPFLASAVLVLLGLYVRLTITETPVFAAAMERREAVKVPIFSVVRNYFGVLVAATLTCLATFVIFYLMIVFTLTWATSTLHYGRNEFLLMQLAGVVFFALTIPVAAVLAELGRKPVMIVISLAIAVYGLFFARMFEAGHTGALAMLIVGLSLAGLTYGPVGTVLSELFPTAVRYTGSSLAFSVAGILGASLTPYIATRLATTYGLRYVGYYLSAAAALTIVGLLGNRETKDEDLSAAVETALVP